MSLESETHDFPTSDSSVESVEWKWSQQDSQDQTGLCHDNVSFNADSKRLVHSQFKALKLETLGSGPNSHARLAGLREQ